MELKNLDINLSFNKDNKIVEVSGPLGNIKKRLGGNDLAFVDDRLFFYSNSSHQSYKALLQSCIKGVTEGYQVELTLVGLGFKVIKLGNSLLLKLGHSHYIKFENPIGLHIFGAKKRLLIFGLDKRDVNNVANTLRSFRRPDAYKGKGVQNITENIVLKIGKQK